MKNNHNTYFSLFLFISILLFSWWSHPSLIPKIAPDSYDYISIAQDFNDPSNAIRPFFFPLFLRICMFLSQSQTDWNLETAGMVFSIFQILLHASVCLLLFLFYQRMGLKPIISFLLVLVIGLNPSILFYTTYVISDYFMNVLITMSWMMFIILMERLSTGKTSYIYILSYIVGFLNGLASMTKLIWLYAIFPFIVYMIKTAGLNKKTLKISMIIILLNFSFYFFWSFNKNDVAAYGKLYSQTYYGINMASIRMGLVDKGKDTKLYQYLIKNDLMESAQKCNGDDNENFRKVYWEVPFEIKQDGEFAKQILKEAPFKFLFGQLSNWHTFFTKRMFSPNTNAFPYMPDSLRYLYIGSYYNLYRPLLVPLLICFLILGKNKLYRILVISTLIVLIYYSMLHVIFAASPGHFIRYRVAVEYVLFFSALLPVGLALQNRKFNLLKWT